jgi:rod shape-determining protein MreC
LTVALLDTRRRTGVLFFTVVLGHIILISAQVNSRRGVPVLEALTFGAFAEIQRAASSGVSGVLRTWHAYIDLRHVREENERLKQEFANAQIELQRQRSLADRSRGLERLLGIRDQSALSTVAAQIIGGSANPDFLTVTLDKGTNDGVKSDMAVIAATGVVGRVVMATPRAAKVQLLIDRNAAAGAIVERSRAQGVLVGEGTDRLRMDYMLEASDLAVGDAVMSSGIDGVFPKGFMLGVVETIEKNGPAFKRIVVKPAVDFHALEEVLVVLTPVAGHEGAGGSE